MDNYGLGSGDEELNRLAHRHLHQLFPGPWPHLDTVVVMSDEASRRLPSYWLKLANAYEALGCDEDLAEARECRRRADALACRLTGDVTDDDIHIVEVRLVLGKVEVSHGPRADAQSGPVPTGVVEAVGV